MKSLKKIIPSAVILALFACSQHQPYRIALAANHSNSTQTSSSCSNSLMGPLTYEQYFPAPQRISQFVRRIHEDKDGNLWMGTNGDGVIRYNGDSLDYFTVTNGFAGIAVRGIVEDGQGNVWLGTEHGLSKYTPSKSGFINYTDKDGLINNDIWCLNIDSKGILWIGTLQGVSRYDGKAFSTFVLPETEVDPNRGVSSSRIVHSIMEDSQGRMWFATNGGAYIYDGQSLSNLSVNDALCNNGVNDILEDRNGNFWFATHHNGVCRWDGKKFTRFGEKQGVKGTEVWSLFEDSKGNIWFPSEGYGMYRYDGENFANYYIKQGLSSHAIQCTFEDSRGTIWCGGWMGLFRFDGQRFVEVTKKGPWGDGC